MASRFQSRGWRRCRTAFRWCRITLLLLLLLIVAVGYYLNQIGLPGPLKTRLLNELHARGLDLQFTRLRLRYYRGIVAENVRFGRAQKTASDPSLSAREVELKINHNALRHFAFTVDSLIIHQGDLNWPLVETNRSPRNLSLNGIETRVRFLTNDQVELDHFKASFAGADIRLSGAVTNASAIRDWKVFQPGAEAQPPNLQNRLVELADTLDHLKFIDSPRVSLILHGDGRDPKSFHGLLKVATLGADTPWGALTNGQLVVQLLPPDETNRQPHAEFNLHADDARTRWGSTRGFALEARALVDANETNLVRCNLKLQADEFRTEWAEATNARFAGVWTHSLTNAVPVDGHGELRLANVHTRWGEAGELRLDSRLDTLATNSPSKANASWGWWADFEPYALDWNCRLTDVHSHEFKVREVACAGVWRAPDLTITNLHSELYQGELNFQTAVNVATRALTFKGFFDFDVHSIETALPPGAHNWLKDYTWAKPPTVHGEGGLILPAWTNRQPDWAGEVMPTLWLQGGFQSGPAGYCTIPVLSCSSHILYSNQVWNVPDLVATRPEGRLQLQHIADDKTHQYYFRIHSDIDAQAVRPLPFIGSNEVRVLDMVSFTKPPVVDLELWGRWHVLEQTGIKAHVEVTNFIFRDESASHFHTDLAYTNRLLTFDHPRVERGGRFATADRLVLNFEQQNLFLTNGFSTMEPSAIVHPIGPVVTRTLEPYQFLQPPTVRANGFIPLVDGVPADAHFHLEGGPFHWQRFNVTNISSDVHWVGDHLRLSEMKSEFYGGHLTGSAAFDFATRGPGTDFSFDTIVTDVDLATLVKDVFGPSNHLEGQLNGHLILDKANTEDAKSWFGRGQADLHNGLLWEIPVFGGVSTLLNQIHPGLGESRASEATANFVITNSVINSTDLEIRATKMRLQYKGTTDFNGRVDADATAQVLRDTPVLGPVITPILTPFEKAFECNVTGTLSQPKIELKWLAVRLLTKPIQWLLHPFSTIKGLVPPAQPANPVFPPNSTPAPTPTPPTKNPE